MSQQYRVTHVAHYIGGRLVFPNRGDESLVFLEEGVEPGQYLEPVGGASDFKPQTTVQSQTQAHALDPEPVLNQKELLEEARALGLKPHHATGPEKLKEMIAEAKAKDGGGEEEPPEDKNLPDA